jgi:hypothetical protein
MGLDFIDASSAFPFNDRRVPESATTWNYWTIPPIGNAGGLYHAKFLTINKQKIMLYQEHRLLSVVSEQRSHEISWNELVQVIWTLS